MPRIIENQKNKNVLNLIAGTALAVIVLEIFVVASNRREGCEAMRPKYSIFHLASNHQTEWSLPYALCAKLKTSPSIVRTYEFW